MGILKRLSCCAPAWKVRSVVSSISRTILAWRKKRGKTVAKASCNRNSSTPHLERGPAKANRNSRGAKAWAGMRGQPARRLAAIHLHHRLMAQHVMIVAVLMPVRRGPTTRSRSAQTSLRGVLRFTTRARSSARSSGLSYGQMSSRLMAQHDTPSHKWESYVRWGALDRPRHHSYWLSEHSSRFQVFSRIPDIRFVKLRLPKG